MDARKHGQRVAEYIQALPGFEYAATIDGEYHHMGATLTDAVLQAGLNYESVVRPRVTAIRMNHPAAATTSAFRDLLSVVGAKELLSWKHDEKPNRLIALTEFLCHEGVETEEQLCAWLDDAENVKRLQQLRGVGPKTVHYLGILAGRDDVAVDVHVRQFLTQANVPYSNDEEAREILCSAADELGVRRSVLDHSVWLFMSKRRGVLPSSLPAACSSSRRPARAREEEPRKT